MDSLGWGWVKAGQQAGLGKRTSTEPTADTIQAKLHGVCTWVPPATLPNSLNRYVRCDWRELQDKGLGGPEAQRGRTTQNRVEGLTDLRTDRHAPVVP